MALSAEHMARMAEGRRKAKEAREAAAAAAPVVIAEPDEIVDIPMGGEKPPEPLVSEPMEPEPDDEFGRFLHSLTEEQRGALSEGELREIHLQIMADALQERKKQLTAQVKSKAKDFAAAAAGTITKEQAEAKAVRAMMQRPTRITVELPYVPDRGGHISEDVVIDGVRYCNGQSYVMPLAKALDIRKIIYEGYQGTMTFEGRSKLYSLRQQRHDMLSGEVRFVG